MTETYEYFMKDVRFQGKHSKYVDALWTQNDIKKSYIRTLYELYGIAAVIGLRMGITAPLDTSEGTRNLQAGQLAGYRPVLNTIMTTVLLLDETTEISKEDRISRAFKKPDSEEKLNRNTEIFDSYVRGGIEYLYDELIVRPLSIDDPYTDIKVGNIMALLNAY